MRRNNILIVAFENFSEAQTSELLYGGNNMRNVFARLRVKCFICRLRLKNFCFKITEPFQIVNECIKRYCVLRKIDQESNGGWERYVKRKELERKDELALRREQFYLLKTQLIGSFFRTGICATSCSKMKEQSNELDNSHKEFLRNKEELVSLLEKFCHYDEITFDEKIKSEIISWEFGKFETQEELNIWAKSFSEYIHTLDII